MAIWTPEPGEVLLARDSIVFATGTAPKVSGMRWFRDPRRNDIHQELPGWPAGPCFALGAEPGKTPGGNAAALGLRALYVAIGGALEALGGTGGFLPGRSAGPGRPQEPENEVEDFPVMWAEPDSVARTLPWQLDPARCPESCRTHLIVTDRRLVVVGFTGDDLSRDEVLWEIDRSEVSGAETMRCSAVGGDIRIHFADGSWCRLAPPSSRVHWSITRHLAGCAELVSSSDLTSRQSRYVDSYVSSLGERNTSVEPVITRRRSGNFLIEVTTTIPVKPDHGLLKSYAFMSKAGRRGGFNPADL
ncbi:hypothetical protein ABZ858_28330 [Streptomyces sp. NPDC047017]|uniref:hypothetical protein n=1 Tax=Streptomyces sp. NPDC047017 TaxID=3155024 RepID=UPI0033F32D1F